MDKATEERVNKPVEFQEFPKMLYHPDGRQLTVNSDEEESKAGSDWHPTPQDAIDEKTRRDAADAKRAALAVGREAAGAGKTGKTDA